MKKLYLIEYSYRGRNHMTEHGKLAVEADTIQKAVAEVFVLPEDEFEKEEWAKNLKDMETLHVTFYCYK